MGLGGAGAGVAGVVDQPVVPADRRPGHRADVAHAGFVGDVQALERGIITALPFVQAGLARFHVQIADQHASAGAEHGLGDATADAVGAAGDQHRLARQRRGRPCGNRRHHAPVRASPRRRRCQPSTPRRSRGWMWRATSTAGAG
ncbi:hypothetical protein G6F59_015834 [Rhizopus arrhizus]|nr:hypothetical protein G6F59_015834 [Rhizopus arrhizus]